MLSQNQITAIYCIVDDFLKISGHREDKRSKLSDSEIITIGLVAALSTGCNYQKAFDFLYDYGFIVSRICKSRLIRRIHRLSEEIDCLFRSIGEFFTHVLSEKEFIVDSTPLEVCDNIRILRCKLLQGEEFRGYKASFRRYFYGLRLQLITTKNGVPIEYFITEAQLHDSEAIKEMKVDLSPESIIYADAGYTDYEFEDLMEEIDQIEFLAQRKNNSKRPRTAELTKKINKARKRIETVFSQIKDLFKRKIHAVTIEGFMLKIKYFLLAYQLKSIQ